MSKENTWVNNQYVARQSAILTCSHCVVKKPIFPEQQDVTLPLCQGKYYATLYDEKWGIARYSLYKITAKDAEKAMSNPVARPKGDPWKQTLGN